MSDRPHVRVDPAQRFGRPNVKGVPVDAIADAVWVGETVEVVADEYGLTRPDVLVACWWAGKHEPRFRRWSEEVAGKLWRQEYDVPDPPCKADEEATDA